MIYSSVCGIITLGLVAMMILAIIESFTRNDGWTGIGGFVVCIVFVLPLILGLVLFEAVTLKKKNGYTPEDMEMIRRIAEELKQLPTKFYTGHCTGEEPYAVMKEIMGDRLMYIHSGDTFK